MSSPKKDSQNDARSRSPSTTVTRQSGSSMLNSGISGGRSGSVAMKSGSSGAEVRTDHVKKNNKGGVLVTSDELENAFELLDHDKTGTLTVQNLKKVLGVMFPHLTAKEYRFLMNNKKEINLQDLKDLLLENEITNFDPVAEAYKAFESETTEGKFDGDKLRRAFISYGFGELSDEELELLTRVRLCCSTSCAVNLCTVNIYYLFIILLS